MKRLLSIDGGGVKGVRPARILSYLEQRIGLLSAETWDLIVGTSTGGILAAGLAHPKGYSAAELLKLYVDYGAVIFHRHWYDPISAFHVKYPATGLHDTLYKFYGDSKLSEARTDILITAFDEVKWRPQLFKSRKAKKNAADDYPLWYAAQATASAPTYFPNLDGLVDGGMLGGADPSMIALTEARMAWPGEELFLCSIGCGHRDSSIGSEQSAAWGTLGYLKPLVTMFLEAPAKLVERMVSESLGRNYVRLQSVFPDPPPSREMDDASASNIQALIAFANDGIREQAADIDRIVEVCRL